MKHVTIKDIARHLSLSVSTVSRALADDKNIRRETKERISKAAEELGYRRNPLAATLRTGKSNTVGVLFHEMLTPVSAEVLAGIQRIMHSHGINVLIADAGNSPEQEKSNLMMMENAMVDGLIIGLCHSRKNEDELKRIASKGLPMVFFTNTPRSMDASHVKADFFSHACCLMEHLIDYGRSRIAHVRGSAESAYFAELHRAYMAVLQRKGITPDPSLTIEVTPDLAGGTLAADMLLDSGVEFDAVFASCDLLAIGVMNRLRERGTAVPRDVSVAGFHGSALAEMVYPSLTTVEPPLQKMGEEAAGMLIELINKPETPPRGVIVDANVVIRESSHVTAPTGVAE